MTEETLSPTHDLFISYRSSDLALAEVLDQRLRHEGFRVWFDKLRLNPGCDWHREIEAGCDASRIILPVLTPRWRESEWCLFEGYSGENVIPLLCDGEWDDVAPPPLRSYQFLELRNVTEGNWAKLLSTIRDSLSRPRPAKVARLASLPIAHNPHFVGRDHLLLELHERLFQAPSTVLTQATVHAIAGMGGIGKTTLAREYAEKFWRLYDDILWVRAEGNSFTAEFARLALELGLISTLSDNAVEDAGRASHELASQTRRLLILDNAESEHLVQPWIPKSGGCRTVITSRFVGWSATVAEVRVDVLDADAARRLLLSRSGLSETDAAAADKLAEEVGYLPLALEQAAAFVRKVSIDFGEYLQMYADSRSELLAERALGGTQYPHSVATTWRTTVEHLSPLARAILRLAAFLAPDHVPVQMLEQARKQLRELADDLFSEGQQDRQAEKQRKSRHPVRGRHGEVTPLALRRALGELAEYSMITLHHHTFSTHRLVQAVEIDRLKPLTRRRWAIRGVRIVNLVFPEPTNPYSMHGGHYNQEVWSLCYSLLPSAKCCMNIVEQFGLAGREGNRLNNKIHMYESDINYKEEWDRSGGLWE